MGDSSRDIRPVDFGVKVSQLATRAPAVPLARLPGSLPQVSIADDADHAAVATSSIQNLSGLTAAYLTKDAFWRDLYALSGTLRTFYGSERVEAAWTELSKTYRPSAFALTPGTSRIARFGPKISWIEAAFSFHIDGSPAREASGVIKIVPDQENWKIWVISTILERIKGFSDVDLCKPPAEKPARQLISATTIGTSSHVSHHDVAIVGAGQAGLALAGRLKALGVSCVAMDKNVTIGGNWTTRYESFKLHTAKEYGNLPFGRTWGPEYGYFLHAREIAEGYKRYVDQHDLDIWLSTTVNHATWNPGERKWAIEITSDGAKKNITACHLVLAIGAGGQTPKMPTIPNEESFSGTTLHSVDYSSSSVWKGKSGVIIGTANTAHDVAEDMVDAGLASVTMVQRNPTPIFPITVTSGFFDSLFNEKIPTERADRMYFSAPIALSRQLAMHTMHAHARQDSEYFDSLDRAGFKTVRFVDLYHQIFERLGGHYLDVGASAKVVQGLIKVKSDSAISQFTPSGLHFEDGSKLDADVIVFATGFEGNMRQMAANMVDQDVADELEDSFHVDGEGEARFFSRFMALSIKADLEGVPMTPYTKYRPDQ